MQEIPRLAGKLVIQAEVVAVAALAVRAVTHPLVAAAQLTTIAVATPDAQEQGPVLAAARAVTVAVQLTRIAVVTTHAQEQGPVLAAIQAVTAAVQLTRIAVATTRVRDPVQTTVLALPTPVQATLAKVLAELATGQRQEACPPEMIAEQIAAVVRSGAVVMTLAKAATARINASL